MQQEKNYICNLTNLWHIHILIKKIYTLYIGNYVAVIFGNIANSTDSFCQQNSKLPDDIWQI